MAYLFPVKNSIVMVPGAGGHTACYPAVGFALKRIRSVGCELMVKTAGRDMFEIEAASGWWRAYPQNRGFSLPSITGLIPWINTKRRPMKIAIILLALLLASPSVFARGGRSGGGRSHSYHSAYHALSSTHHSQSHKASAYRSRKTSHSQTADYASSGTAAAGSTIAENEKDENCHIGPRGGRYTISPSGWKRYGTC